ncbi:MAG: deoxyribonuclease IV [Deltaproteobacteria bacterium]|nr:deoxyribonuclease IV [Deltaproteobacteria bacterium]MBW2070473.1 deoxyribonuclease IV [Deltaproteobacteria bacterium]
MPLFGAHMSIAGGLHLAFQRIQEVQGDTLQIFTRNQRQWRSPPLSTEEIQKFQQYRRQMHPMPVAAHDSYLTNLAAPPGELLDKSMLSFAGELQRLEALQIPFLITHPGSHLGQGREAGLKRYVRNLDQAISAAAVSQVTILIETTAGQGTNLGSSFEEIAYILENSRYSHMLGVCLDTCHIFAAGYDFRSRKAYEATFSAFDKIVGLQQLKFIHLNDSRRPLGSRVDRHQHIGAGHIGLAGFQLLVNDPRFQTHPMVLETPKGQTLLEDRKNLDTLRSLHADSPATFQQKRLLASRAASGNASM